MAKRKQDLKPGAVAGRSRIFGKPTDEQTKELIAIGVSIGAHCQPCLTYHVNRAKEIGISDNAIRAAMAVGHMVEQGSMAAMQNFAKGALDKPKQGNLPAEASAQAGSACCPDKTAAGGKSCC